MASKRNGIEPAEYDPAATIVLDDGAVMDTGEFRELVALDPDLLNEIGSPDRDD